MKDESKTFFGHRLPDASKMNVAIAALRVMCKDHYPAEAVEGVLDIIDRLQSEEKETRKCA